MTKLSRRAFARTMALSGMGTFFPVRSGTFSASDIFDLSSAPLPPAPLHPGETYWQEVRSRFLIPRDAAFLNAANLCPTSLPALEALEEHNRRYDAEPSPAVRASILSLKEDARRLIAESLRVTPEEIVLTRNASEANNFVSSGIQLGAGDEVVLFSDNHPSNLRAWQLKGARFGFSVRTVPQVNPHPGVQFYVDAFASACSPATRVLAFSHISSNSGDLLPAAELCEMARERGVLTLVDGAQSFGALDIDLSRMRPDFYTGSMHKWPCGPKECGLLYINSEVHDRIHPSVVSLYPGQVGISRTMEALGQRDDAALAALLEAVKLHGAVGRPNVEQRGRELAQQLMSELRRMDGVRLWTDPDPAHSAAVVVFQPASLNVQRLGAALYEDDRVVCTTRTGADRPGLRISLHFYNTQQDLDRFLSALRRYLAAGV